MLYIEKEGLPNDINRKIIELSKSEEWKSIGEDDTTWNLCILYETYPYGQSFQSRASCTIEQEQGQGN